MTSIVPSKKLQKSVSAQTTTINESINTNFEDSFFDPLKTYVHPTAVVGKNVELGQGVKVGPFCVLVGNIKIGQGTRLHAHVTVGFPAQDAKTFHSLGTIEIGSNCEIREFVTIHASKKDGGITKIGNNCYIMNYAHVSHDCILEDNVILINNVNLAGHSYIEHHAMLMANSAVHQFCRVGAFANIVPFSGIRQDVPPFCVVNGLPAKFSGINRIGMRRNGYSSTDIDALNTLTKLFYIKKLLMPDLEKELAKQNLVHLSVVSDFLTFVKNSQRGVSRKSALLETEHCE